MSSADRRSRLYNLQHLSDKFAPYVFLITE